MAAHPELEFLKSKVASGQVDTVVACIPDMQGRLMGKRFHASHFVDSAWEETHCCDYLVATDLEMHPVDGYASTSWAAGYGDHVLRPDLSTMRYPSWLEGTAVVLGDLLDHHGHDLVPHAPRTVLKRQIERLSSRGLSLSVATELEFFLFRESYDDLRDRNYRSMTPSSPYNEDYHVFQTTRDEDVMRAIRNGLHAAGVAVENTKGEADPGQQEINIRHDAALETADTHVFVKNAIKEIAFQKGRSVTFMAKWNADAAGSSCHIHQSVTDSSGESTFFDPVQDHGMSRLMRQYLAGLLTHSAATTVFLAPYVNSYKRFVAGTFAPTKAVWAIDNRTAGFRIAGAGTNGVRVRMQDRRCGPQSVSCHCRADCRRSGGNRCGAGTRGRLRGRRVSGGGFEVDPGHASRCGRCPRGLGDAAFRHGQQRDRPLCQIGALGAGTLRSRGDRLRGRARSGTGLTFGAQVSGSLFLTVLRED